MFQRNLWRFIGICWLLCCVGSASAQEVVLAFDGTLARSTSLDGMARSQMIIHNMARADVNQAIFFIHAKDITEKTSERVMFYDDTGQMLVNAGSHYSLYSRQNAFAYQVDILKADEALSPFLRYRQHVYFPYLYQGGDEAIKQHLQDFLVDRQFQPVYVTYRANDDYLDRLYQARIAENRSVDIQKLETAYVNLIMDGINTYNAKATLLLGFSPRQVVVLHENDLAAYFVLALIDALNAKGFKVISPDKVFSDPVVNPFFYQGFSATGYMQYLTFVPDARDENLHELTRAEIEKVHSALRQQGLESLIPAQ